MKALDDGKYPFITNPNYCSPSWQKAEDSLVIFGLVIFLALVIVRGLYL
jgi:hypothetical protein